MLPEKLYAAAQVEKKNKKILELITDDKVNCLGAS